MTDEASTTNGSPLRNIGLLATSQAIVGSNQAILMSVGALTAAGMVADKSIATLPVSGMIVGTALATTPAAWLIHRIGRRQGFMAGAALVIPAAILAGIAAWTSQFWLFVAALFVIGGTQAFAQQYRFAAADSVPPDWKPKAISWVLAGGVVSGFLGPQISAWTKGIVADHAFAATYLVMAGMALFAVFVLSFTRLAPTRRHDGGAYTGRSMSELLRTPAIIVPMISAAASYALMTLVMVAAPLAMVYVCGHTTEAAAFAIQWHIVSMFAPSFFTAAIIQRLGAPLTASMGLLAIIAAAAINLHGTSTLHFDIALILLGVGWNFGFIASTAMLSAAYRPEEAARVQALNEQVVFGVMAIASIASGALLQWIGWQALNVLAIPVATGAILALFLAQTRGARA